ncbi:unnamed protein product [Rotaria sp. Silwood1]|nr:unnamed protein product [Rotaria sp. Silwood1]CAF4922867.1 unnamed protein product [Rotaria sp. Silwood1]
MSAYNIRNPVRCFCSFVAKHTNDNIFVCGRYKSGSMVCLFHLHDENLEHYYQTNSLPLSFDCDMCLATIKIHSKEYIAPCRLPSVRCHCEQSCKGILNQDHDEINQKEYEELRKQLECVICLSGERCCLISPCNHLCCCATCAKKIQNHCPICRGDIESIQRIFFV